MPDLWMDVDTNLSEVPVNILPLLDDADFKTRKEAVAYNAAGLELIWHFTTTAGATSATVVTPTTGGAYDWAHQDGGMYTIEIPASGGASINNDAEGFGWFTGIATGVLPWRGPIIGFRAAGLNNLLIDDAYSTTRGLAGTALPAAAADAAGGLPISDAGGLDIDAKLANTNEVTAARMGALTDLIDGGRLDLLIDAIKAKTDNLPADPADDSDIDAQLATIAGYLDTEIAAILAAVDTEIAAIKAKTDQLNFSGTDVKATLDGETVTVATNNDKTGYALTAAYDAAKTAAAAGAKMDLVDAPNATAITAIQSGLATSSALSTVAGYVDTEVASIKGVTDKLDTALEADGGVYRLTANALEQAPSGSGATAQEVWEYTTRTLTSAGSGGATAQEVWEYATRTLTALDEDSTTLDLDTTIAAAVPAASAIADAVLDEALSGHTTAGTLGKAVADTLADTNELQTNQGNWATATGFSTHSAADVVTAIGTGSTFTAVPWNAAWDAEVQSECTDALNAYDPPTKAEMDAAIAGGDDAVLARLGTPAGASVSADIAAVKAETASILEDTGTTIPATLATIEGKIDTADTVVDAIKAVTDAIGATGSGLSAVPWNPAWDAEVQSECADALNAYDPPTKAELDAADDAILAVLGTPAGADMAADIAALPTATENADALLNRDMSAVSDTTARSPLNALRQLRNKVAIVAGTMTVYEEDDATEAWTAALTTDASAEAITVVDPA